MAKVNEDPTEKLIRELQEENKKLKEMLASGKLPAPRDDDDSEEEEDGDLTDAGRCCSPGSGGSLVDRVQGCSSARGS